MTGRAVSGAATVADVAGSTTDGGRLSSGCAPVSGAGTTGAEPTMAGGTVGEAAAPDEAGDVAGAEAAAEDADAAAEDTEAAVEGAEVVAEYVEVGAAGGVDVAAAGAAAEF